MVRKWALAHSNQTSALSVEAPVAAALPARIQCEEDSDPLPTPVAPPVVPTSEDNVYAPHTIPCPPGSSMNEDGSCSSVPLEEDAEPPEDLDLDAE